MSRQVFIMLNCGVLLNIHCCEVLVNLNLIFQEADKLAKQLDDMRKNLAEETLLRVDIENRLQSLKEDFEFKESVSLIFIHFTFLKILIMFLLSTCFATI